MTHIILAADRFSKGIYSGNIKYTIAEDNPYYYMDDDVCYEATDDGQYRVLFCQNKKAGHIIINDGTVSIAKFAFSMPDTYYCFSDYPAAYFTRLKTIELPSSLVTIGKGAFMHCSALETVAIGPCVKDIDSTAFFGCKKLTKITVSPDNPHYSDIDGVLFDKAQKKLIIYPEGRKTKVYEMPESTEEFGTAFANIACINTLRLSHSIQWIEEGAFPARCMINDIYG